jgi:hypothetical protein
MALAVLVVRSLERAESEYVGLQRVGLQPGGITSAYRVSQRTVERTTGKQFAYANIAAAPVRYSNE